MSKVRSLVVKNGVVATEAALMFDAIYVLAYSLQKLEEAVHPVSNLMFFAHRMYLCIFGCNLQCRSDTRDVMDYSFISVQKISVHKDEYIFNTDLLHPSPL